MLEFDFRQLALDTLHNRNGKTALSTSCFIFNEAGLKLRGCHPDAIPVLEGLMQELVVPAMDEYREKYGIPDWSSMFREGPPFAGLNEFLGAYWIICARSEPSSAVKFIGKMTRPVVNEAVSRLAMFFNPSNPMSDVPLPSEYIDYIHQLSESDVDEFRSVASYVIERLGLSESRGS